MTSCSIQVLKPNVSRDEAIRTFRAGSLSALYWRIRGGRLQRIADVYVPFWVYRVRYEMNRGAQTRIFALDAVLGALDMFEFPRVPGSDELQNIATNNRLASRLAPAAAEELLRTKVLRVLFQQGFFKLNALKLEIEHVPVELYLPYWLAFYGDGGIVRLRVMDAVRRRIEGAKASSFFEEWLAA